MPLWLFVICVSQTLLMVGGSRFKALLVLLQEETDPSVDPVVMLSDCRHPCFRNVTQ